VIEEIANTVNILAFRVGADDFSRTHPFRVAKIAHRFPELRILMAHMGGAASPDLGHEAIEVAQECPNTMLMGSAIDVGPVLRAIKTPCSPRVCFGSDVPFRLMRVEVAKYHALLEGEVAQEDKYNVMASDIAGLFGRQA
jgi:predicted TIM-barrel fold metal-dependent hydrolase